MKNMHALGLPIFILIVTLTFSAFATSAFAGEETATGVIFADGHTSFSIDDNFLSTRLANGVYIIEVGEQLECRFRPDGFQAALGPRLATSVSPHAFVTSPLFFVPSDIAGGCNPTAKYIFRACLTGNFNIPADVTFNFQITEKEIEEDD